MQNCSPASEDSRYKYERDILSVGFTIVYSGGDFECGERQTATKVFWWLSTAKTKKLKQSLKRLPTARNYFLTARKSAKKKSVSNLSDIQ